jgi:group I intron endonuclease
VPVSLEARAKLRAAQLGKNHTLETRQLMSETRKGSNNPMFGKSLSEEHKAKISSALKGPDGPLSGIPRSAETINLMRVNHSHTKTVFQYTSDKMTLVANFDSIRQAAKVTGISRDYLSLCLKQGKLAHDKWFFSSTPLN